MIFNIEVYKRILRDYYNEVCDIMNDLEEEEITFDQSEKALIQLDEKYAQRLAQQ